MEWRIFTHEGGFEDVAAHKDLVGGRDGAAVLGGAAVDLGHAVEVGTEDDQGRGGHGLDHQGAAAALEVVDAHDDELAEHSAEEERRHRRGLRSQHGEEKLDHLSINFCGRKEEMGVRYVIM